MKIDITSNYTMYRKNISGEGVAVKNSASKKDASKTDVVDFSRGQTAVPDKTTVTLKAGLQRDISAPADKARIASLQESVKNNTYRVSTEELIESILNA